MNQELVVSHTPEQSITATELRTQIRIFANTWPTFRDWWQAKTEEPGFDEMFQQWVSTAQSRGYTETGVRHFFKRLCGGLIYPVNDLRPGNLMLYMMENIDPSVEWKQNNPGLY